MPARPKTAVAGMKIRLREPLRARLEAAAKAGVPAVVSTGCLDMVNFGSPEAVPAKFAGRKFYQHNPQVTLMRTTPEECRAIGEFIARKLNAMAGPVRFLIPEGGVSAIDSPGQPFHDPEADRVLFATIESNFRPGVDRKLQRLPLHINDKEFAEHLVYEFLALTNVRSQ